MIQSEEKNSLFINKLVVFNSEKIAYSQSFKKGVNIIRGENSSGKSTIMDFLFFVLGGDFNNWTKHAIQCTDVVAELTVNEAIITIGRKVTDKLKQSMYIFDGALDDAVEVKYKEWKEYPFQRNDNKLSFSQVLFKLLDYPEAKAETDENITMHQVLRLIYIDQLTGVHSLMRQEDFDSPTIRKAVVDFLLGGEVDEIFRLETELRKAKKEYLECKNKYKMTKDVLLNVEHKTSIEDLMKQISTYEKKLDTVNNSISKAQKAAQARVPNKSSFQKAQANLIGLRSDLSKKSKELSFLEMEVFDSKDFIDTLNKKIQSIVQSNNVIDSYKTMEMKYCPQCLSPIVLVDNNSCSLCKTPSNDVFNKAQLARMQQELEIQIKESNKIIEKNQSKYKKIKQEYLELESKIILAQKNIDNAHKSVSSTRNDKIDNLLLEKGRIEAEILGKKEQLNTIYYLEDLQVYMNNANDKVIALESAVLKLDKNQAESKRHVKELIQDQIIDLLTSDLDRQEEFKSVREVKIDYSKNSFSLDGNNQFAASSKVYVKNSIHFGLFFASLKENLIRYPKLIICDNIEDKGLEPERSHNFQRVLVRKSEEYYDRGHQLIFSTSMIAPDLDNEKYCIGDKYTKDNKSLTNVV